MTPSNPSNPTGPQANPIRLAILTVSDRCSKGLATDTSGPALADMATLRLGAKVIAQACLPDERDLLAQQMRHWAHMQPTPDLILTTGGTGLAPRDVTPEATLDVIERNHNGLMELIRLRCYEKTPRAYLSRGQAGTVAQTLIINLPGSQRGATESLEAILDILPHAIETLRGDVQDDGRRDAKATSGKVIHHEH